MRLAPQDVVDTGRLKGIPSFTAVDPAAALYRLPDDAVAFAGRLAPGARLSVRVEAELPEGGSRGRTLDGGHEVKLPFAAKVGDLLELVLVSNSPQPTFRLLTATATGAAQLSSAARALTDLVQLAAAHAPRPSAPLVDGPPTDTSRLAATLERALALSGLFYESHQAQWLAGLRSRDELMREPQARLGRAPGVDTPQTDTAASGTDARADLAQVVHREAVPLVQQQLAALESGVVAWRGMAWPGQTMEWDVAHDRERAARDDAASAWHTRLKLTLPRLGTLTATLDLDAGGVRVRIVAGRAPVANALRAGVPELASRLLAAGLAVLSIEVRHAE